MAEKPFIIRVLGFSISTSRSILLLNRSPWFFFFSFFLFFLFFPTFSELSTLQQNPAIALSSNFLYLFTNSRRRAD